MSLYTDSNATSQLDVSPLNLRAQMETAYRQCADVTATITVLITAMKLAVVREL